MYDLIPFFLGGIIILMGLFMFISPVNATKEEFRNDEKMVSKTKKNGIFTFFILGSLFFPSLSTSMKDI